jgi:integrating conjugative element protein (TIGR03752 family)
MVANRILPIVGGIVILMALFVGIKSCSQQTDDSDVTLKSVPQAPAPDVDSPADTIRTLTAEVATIQAQSKVLDAQNKQLLKQRNEIAGQVVATVRDEIRREEVARNDSAFAQLTDKLSILQNRIDDIGAKQSAPQIGTGDIPPGLGIGPRGDDPPTPAMVWVEPLDASADKRGNPVYKTTVDQSESLLHDGESLQSAVQPQPEQDDESEPVYTVPRNATLIGSTGMTALLGRIPFENKIEDPFPFKVIVGSDNLAANGIDIPGLDGMIFSGTATGDWTLSCVRGEVISVTYVFQDGTIRTLSSDDRSLNNDSSGSNNRNRPLGWISDRRGIPCIAGERISNTASYLTARIFAKGVEAGAQAFAVNETTNVVSPLAGTTTSTVTGNGPKFAGYSALAGAGSEISDYIRERMAQSFDVIYVDTGAEIAVHIDRELPIDYQQNGRRTAYAGSANRYYTNRPLD